MHPAADLTRALPGAVGQETVLVFFVAAAIAGFVVGLFTSDVVARITAGSVARSSTHPDAARPRAGGDRWAIALSTAVAFAGITAVALSVSPPTPALVPVVLSFLYLGAISIPLIVIDIRVHRLPDAIVIPSYAVALGLFAVAAAMSGAWDALLRAGIGATLMLVGYLVLALVRRGGMGLGDVKLAGLIGLYLGWVGWSALLVGAVAAFVVGGLFALVLLISRRADRSSAIAFGPFMLVGAWTGILAVDALGRSGGRS